MSVLLDVLLELIYMFVTQRAISVGKNLLQDIFYLCMSFFMWTVKFVNFSDYLNDFDD